MTRSSGAVGNRQTRVLVLRSPEEAKAAHRIKPCLRLAPLKPEMSGISCTDVTERQYAVSRGPAMLSSRFIIAVASLSGRKIGLAL